MKSRIKPRVSVPLMQCFKVKGYDIAERVKEYRKQTPSDIIVK